MFSNELADISHAQKLMVHYKLIVFACILILQDSESAATKQMRYNHETVQAALLHYFCKQVFHVDLHFPQLPLQWQRVTAVFMCTFLCAKMSWKSS